MRRVLSVSAVVVAAFLAFLMIIGLSGSDAIKPLTPPANAGPAAPLGEIGPGACWPKNKPDFKGADGPAKAAKWLRTPAGKAIAEAYHKRLKDHRDYYLVNEVVPEWDDKSLSNVERAARYVSKLVASQLTRPIWVMNTYCKGGKVVDWKAQVLPVGEWIFWIPGHEQESKDPRMAFKVVCGNMLGFVPAGWKPSPSPGASTSPPSPPCEGKSCVTTSPPPGCERGCTTTPPPGGKKPNEAPGNGGEGDGGDSQHGGPGSDRQRVNEPVSPPKAGDPPPRREDPPPPPADPPRGANPAPSKPAPPPATGAPAPTAAPTQCVNPPGMNVCD